jgi:transposase
LSDDPQPRAHKEKRSLGASERDEWQRLVWRAELSKVDARRLVFVDECGTNTSLAPLYAYAPKGRRAYSKLPRNRGANITLLSSISVEGMEPSMVVVGSVTREVFEAYVEQFLCPDLKAGQVVVMDNLAAHKGKRVGELIEARVCELLYLPPYSPDLNPIEEAFSKFKRFLRQIGARTREILVEAIGKALDAVTARDARGFFAHCGYRILGQ